MKIRWNTNVNAPCCPGEIVAEDGQTRLVQTDWDYPGTATVFGWELQAVQKCNRKSCKRIHLEAPDPDDDDTYNCTYCGKTAKVCHHDGTDGTVDCHCGVTAANFIAAAHQWLEENNEAEAEDPGYFTKD